MVASVELLNELVDRFENATSANARTTGRKGSIVQLGTDEAAEVVVAGDLHGNRENFQKILKAAALDKNPRRHLVLQEVVHGGPAYPSGGCMSHMLLEDVAALKVRYPDRFHFLLCNHELAECLDFPIKKGEVSQNEIFLMGMTHAYGPAAVHIARSYHAFIRSCPLAIRLRNGVFISHSIPDQKSMATFDIKVFSRVLSDSDLRAGGSAHALVWGRDQDPTHVKRFAEMVKSTVLLNGHMPAPAGFDRPNDLQFIFDASGPKCWVCVAPVDRPVTGEQLLAKRLFQLQ